MNKSKLRIHWRFSTILKTSIKMLWIFWYVKVCIFWLYTLRLNTNVKKISSVRNKCYKKCPFFFFRELQFITVLFLIYDSYMSWSTRFVSETVCGILHFLFRFVFIKVYIFGRQNAYSLTLKLHNSFQY